jgi:hypothetical protein
LPSGFQDGATRLRHDEKAWTRLKPAEQAKGAGRVRQAHDDVWAYSESTVPDALNCNAGKDPCTTGKKFKLVDVPVDAADLSWCAAP